MQDVEVLPEQPLPPCAGRGLVHERYLVPLPQFLLQLPQPLQPPLTGQLCVLQLREVDWVWEAASMSLRR